MKKERHSEDLVSDDGSIIPSDKKPSNIWVLTDWAAREGVQSTTRYRNSKNHSSTKMVSARAYSPLRSAGRRIPGHKRISQSYNFSQPYPPPQPSQAQFGPEIAQHQQHQFMVSHQINTLGNYYPARNPAQGMDALCRVALCSDGYPGQLQMPPTSHPAIRVGQSPTDEPKTPELPESLSGLPEPVVGPEPHYNSFYTETDAYPLPIVTGMSEKDHRLFVPDGYTSTSGPMTSSMVWPGI